MDLESKITEQSNRITKRFYNCLNVTDESQFDGLKQDVETTMLKIAREYAEDSMNKIIDDLFTNGNDDQATALKQYDGERYLGGWSKFGAQGRIKKILEAQDGK